jgi:hypothetical protein
LNKLAWALVPIALILIAIFLRPAASNEVVLFQEAEGHPFFGEEYITQVEDRVFFRGDIVLCLTTEKSWKDLSPIDNPMQYEPTLIHVLHLLPGISTLYAFYQEYGDGWATSNGWLLIRENDVTILYSYESVRIIRGALSPTNLTLYEQFVTLRTRMNESTYASRDNIYVLSGGAILCLNTSTGEFDRITNT